MRELTAIEIDQLDFSGRIPDMNMPTRRQDSRASAKHTNRSYALKTRPFAKIRNRKRPARIGMAQTA